MQFPVRFFVWCLLDNVNFNMCTVITEYPNSHIWVKSLVMDIFVETLEGGQLVKDFKLF